MRAVVLSNSKVIKLLNKHYVSVFLHLRDLLELQNGTKGDQASKLAALVTEAYEKTITRNPDHSVHSFVLSPRLELIGHLPYRTLNESRHINEKGYYTFLVDALETVKMH